MATCPDLGSKRISDIEEGNILTAIVVAVSFGALGLVVTQMSLRLDATNSFVKNFGFVVALSMWGSSILLVLTSLWRHYLNKKGVVVTRTDVIFYVSVAVVISALAVAMLWFAVAGLIAVTAKK